MRAAPTINRLSAVVLGTIQGARVDTGAWSFAASSTGGIIIAFFTTTSVTTIGIPVTLDGNDFLEVAAEL
jgi:hypothetical protein